MGQDHQSLRMLCQCVTQQLTVLRQFASSSSSIAQDTSPFHSTQPGAADAKLPKPLLARGLSASFVDRISNILQSAAAKNMTGDAYVADGDTDQESAAGEVNQIPLLFVRCSKP